MAAYQTQLITYTSITATLLTASLALTITSLATNAWLVIESRKTGQEQYGLLGVDKDGQFVSYSDFEDNNSVYATDYHWYGIIVFALLVITALSDLLVLLYIIFTWPLHYLSAFTWKSISMTLITLTAIFQLVAVFLWIYVTSTERHSNPKSTYGYSYWLAFTSAIISLINIYAVSKTFNLFIEYEYLPPLEDDIEQGGGGPATAADPRDVLYPLRQKVRDTGKQIKNAPRVTYQS